MMRAWISFARSILKLPEGNPSLPAGDPESVAVWNPGPGYLGYRTLGLWISTTFLLGVMALLGFALAMATPNMPREVAALLWVVHLAFTGLAVLRIAWGYACIRLELDMLRYTLTDRAMRLRRGVREVREVTLSYANIQNVDFSQGPIQRLFGIADLIVQVAGGSSGAAEAGQPNLAEKHEGRIIGISDPDRLRELIQERVRVVRGGAGLGDAAVETPVSSWDSPKARALLREIRDALAEA